LGAAPVFRVHGDAVSGLVKFFGDFALYYARYAHELADDVLVKVEDTFDSIWRP
jgi:hypothetical protein